MKRFVITTDSNSDLPMEYIKKYEIGIVPHYYSIGDATYGGETELSAKEFYDQMREGKTAATMASNPAVIHDIFERYILEGYNILHISFSSALSGGCSNVSVQALELCEKYPHNKIIVVDSLNVSLSQGMMILKAASLREAGRTLEETADWLESHKMNFCVQFTVDNLHYLQRGGRISKTTALVGSMINVKPILHVNKGGELVSLGSVRGRKRSLNSLLQNVEKRMGRYKNGELLFGIVHGDCPEDADYLAGQLKEKFPGGNMITNMVGPSIGAHSGPGAVGICFMGEER